MRSSSSSSSDEYKESEPNFRKWATDFFGLPPDSFIVSDEIPDNTIILGQRDPKTGKIINAFKYVWEQDE